MSVISPTITAQDPHIYREQVERVQSFAAHLHIDLMDGKFTPNTSLELSQVWLPENIVCDIHLMYVRPEEYLEKLIALKPRMVIVQAEADCDISAFASVINAHDILCGVALLAETSVASVADILSHVQQLMIFSGNLGYQGGSTADLTLLKKVAEAKVYNQELTFGWDGGINEHNIRQLSDGGIEVLNVGGFIHGAQDPALAYAHLAQALAA